LVDAHDCRARGPVRRVLLATMRSDDAPETEIPGTGEEEEGALGAPADGDAAEGAPLPKGGKKKRQWQKVNTADYYNPTPYVAQKGMGKGGKGKGSKGGHESESGGLKGRGRGKDAGIDSEPPRLQDDATKRPLGTEGLSGTEADAMQAKLGLGGKSKKQGGKGRESKGKAVGKTGGGAKGVPRGFGGPGEVPDASAEPLDVPRLPIQPRSPMPPKAGAPQASMAGMPVAMSPCPFGPMPFQLGSAPYPYGAVPAMYAMPYYIMQPPAQLGGAGASMPCNNTLGGAGAGGLSPNPGTPTSALRVGGFESGPGPGPLSPMPPDASSPTHEEQQMAAARGPEEEQRLKTQVQQQIEYYFGNDNLIKDTWLRSEAMDKEGWVSIARIATFKRILSMTSDVSLILDAVTSSQMLETDTQGQRVRLKDGWDKWILLANRT